MNLGNKSRFFMLAGALGLAFTAQYLFTGEFFTHFQDSNTWTWEPRYTLACILLLVAMIFATWALAGHNPGAVLQDIPQPSLGRVFPSNIRHWLALAGGCYALSLVLYLGFGESLIVDLLWLSAALVLIIALWRQSSADPAPASGWVWVGVGAVTALGFVLRYWHLTEIPAHVDNDVALMGTFASKLINSANYQWVGFSDSAHLLSYDQFLAWSMRLFGQNQYGLVMSSVIAGTLTLPLVFWLGWELFNWRVGLISMVLLATNYTHIQFSRILFGPLSTFFATLTFYLLFRGLRTRQPLAFALAGLAAGFGLLVYDSSRIIPVIVIALISWRMFWQKEAFVSNLAHWGIFTAGALIGFGPMLGFALRDFEAFVGRGNSVSLWTPDVWAHEVAAYQVDSVAGVLFEQAKHVFLTFHLYGDGSPHFAFPRPMVAPLTAALLVMGIGYCLWRIRDSRYFSLLAWIGLTGILGGVITYDPPYWPHLNIMLPAVVLVAGLAADSIVESLSPPPGELGYWSLRLGLTGLLFLTGLSNWQAYLGYVTDNAGPRIRIARYISSLPPGYQVYLMSTQTQWSEYAFQFLDHGVAGTDLTQDSLLAAPPALNQPLLFVQYEAAQDATSLLQKFYPSGVSLDHLDSNGNPVFVSFTVVPAGYSFSPAPPPLDPVSLPGWWLIGAILLTVALKRFLPFQPRFPVSQEIDWRTQRPSSKNSAMVETNSENFDDG